MCSAATEHLQVIQIDVHWVPNIDILRSHIFALLILNTETNVINSVRLHISFFSFSFLSLLFVVRVHSGEHEPRVAEVLAPLAPAWLQRRARAQVACRRF